MLSPSIRVLVAVAFAAIGVFGEVTGCVILLGLGVAALVVTPPTHAAPSPLPRGSQFFPWGVCILLFACFVVLLAPFASLPAVVIALLILSPLFGTLVYMVSSAVGRLTRRCSWFRG